MLAGTRGGAKTCILCGYEGTSLSLSISLLELRMYAWVFDTFKSRKRCTHDHQ